MALQVFEFSFNLNPAVGGATGPGVALAQEVMGKATVTPGVRQALPPAGLYVEELAGESACPTTGQSRPTAGFRFIGPAIFIFAGEASPHDATDTRHFYSGIPAMLALMGQTSRSARGPQAPLPRTERKASWKVRMAGLGTGRRPGGLPHQGASAARSGHVIT
jgi:hypothetical protein